MVKKILVLLVGVLISQPTLSMDKVKRWLEDRSHKKMTAKLFQELSKKQPDLVVIEEWFSKAAKVELLDKDGNFPLDYAAVGGDTGVCKLVLEHGAEIDAKNENGNTALISAAIYGYEKVCSLLLDRGAQVDAITKDGRTALRWAVFYGHGGVCRLLLDQGFILPQVDSEKINVFLKQCVSLLCSFKKMKPKIPKDVRFYILLAGWKEEIQELIKHLICTGSVYLIPAYFQGLKNKILNEIAQETFEKQKEMMGDALPRAQNDEMRDMLNPETLDLKKIKDNLILFSQRREKQKELLDPSAT